MMFNRGTFSSGGGLHHARLRGSSSPGEDTHCGEVAWIACRHFTISLGVLREEGGRTLPCEGLVSRCGHVNESLKGTRVRTHKTQQQLQRRGPGRLRTTATMRVRLAALRSPAARSDMGNGSSGLGFGEVGGEERQR